MRENYHSHPQSRLVLQRFMKVLSPDGTIYYRNEKLGERTLGGKPLPTEGQPGYYKRIVTLSDGTRVLMVSHVHIMNQRPLLIRVAYSLKPLERRLEDLLGILLLAFPAAITAAGFAGYTLAKHALNPVRKIAIQTEQITPKRLHERLPVQNPDDELGQMAQVFNHLLDRLEAAFEQLRRFTSDASHELRTPLATIRSVGEVGLQGDVAKDELRDIIGSMLEEVNRLTQMVDSLLTISRADAGQIPLAFANIPMDDLIEEVCSLIEILAQEKGQTLDLQIEKGLVIHGDRGFLRHAIVNILHNAVKYSPPHTVIHLTASRETDRSSRETRMLLEIVDSGSGIAPEDQEKVFERFYRTDKARSQSTGGTGLGLAITKWVVEAHDGTIGLESSPGHGCKFFIRIPVAVTEL